MTKENKCKKIVLKFLLYFVITLALSAFLIWSYYTTLFNTAFYTVTKLFCEISAIFLIWFLLKYLYSIIRKKEKPVAGTLTQSFFEECLKNKTDLFLLLFLVIIIVNIFTNPFFRYEIGYHHLETEPLGSRYAYYVIAESSAGKEYTLPAEVVFSYDSDPDIRYDHTVFDYKEKEEYYDTFIVQRVYFSNGGYLFFEDGLIFKKPNEKISDVDQNGKDWEITLTDRYTKSDMITEYNSLTKSDFIFYCTTIIFAFAEWLLQLTARFKFKSFI